ncbi:insulinoma-associated protein 2 [Carcharodon carcharias]|uniref:insulinoma-associated protein 2 n=1 Tax=Carcharodon carcharias TaxID=13397 RepID=UPI001B7EBB06|nr:insulinoma-associated protein 2 [Carcharodon carcharias]
MPRGFLVKRNNKSSPVSYRIRTEDEEHQLLEVHPLGADARAVAGPDSVSHRNSPDPLNDGLTQDNILNSAHRADVLSEDGASEEFYSKKTFSKCGISGWANVSYTPIKPTDIKLENAFLDRCLSSSASVDSFSAAASLKPVERFLVQPSLPPVDVKRGGITHLHQDPRHRKHKASPKKPKVIRKLNFEDEVSTSPVLGLRIKVDAWDCKPSASANKLLAEFICQLCKERYSDSFSLAQHKCSRIVRVEYRCPECDKVFSCPANLASHRRWHKPRPGGNKNGPNPRKERQNCPTEPGPVDPESKENSKRLGSGDQSSSKSMGGAQTMDSSKDTDSPCAGTLLPPGAGWKVERFECPYCSKRFRRQAYLKKHLAAHEVARSTFPNRLELSRITFPCQLCDVYLPSAEIRNKHLLWHAVSRGEAALLSPSCGQKCSAPRPKEHDDAGDLEGQLFSCKHCPSTFFSSPGLTRHINKCHPSENRQVLLLQLPIRPGC